jgi:fructose-1,6-bisphosphatase
MAVSTSQPSLVSDAPHFTPQELPALRALAQRFPTVDAAVNEIAHLQALLHLPKGTVHIVSDVHGEHKKLQHILNNASGSLLVSHKFTHVSHGGVAQRESGAKT